MKALGPWISSNNIPDRGVKAAITYLGSKAKSFRIYEKTKKMLVGYPHFFLSLSI